MPQIMSRRSKSKTTHLCSKTKLGTFWDIAKHATSEDAADYEEKKIVIQEDDCCKVRETICDHHCK